MRPHLVVIEPPCGDFCTGLVQRLEPVLVQALVAEPTVEALDVAVLHGSRWLDQDVSMPWLCAQPMKARLVNSGPLSVWTAAG